MCPTGTSSTPPLPSCGPPTSEFRQAFDVIDTDHDGKISGEDLRRFYASLGNAGEDEEAMIKNMIAVADANKDGYVQYDEFELVLNGRLKCNNNNNNNNNVGNIVDEQCYGDMNSVVMKEVFMLMDQDGDGLLGLDDLRSYLGRVGLWVDGDDEIKAMIRVGGGDEQHGVGFVGFLNILAMHA